MMDTIGDSSLMLKIYSLNSQFLPSFWECNVSNGAETWE